MARISRPPGFDMTYRPLETQAFGPPMKSRLPSFIYLALAMALVATVIIGSNAASGSVLFRYVVELDSQRMTVTWSGKPVDLTVTEFWMVHSLARHPGHVKDREQLMRDAHIVVDDATITSHVKRIRRKFQAVEAKFNAIDAVYGMGYRWNS